MNGFTRLSFALVMALSLGQGQVSPVVADSGAAPLRHTGRHNQCPRCATYCELKVEQVDKSKYCWKVEREKICIPKVVFPWQKKCCDPLANNGAWVKTVHVLKKHEYTCPACEYSWTPVDRGCCGVGCCNAGCVACDGMPIDMGISVPDAGEAPMPPPLTAYPANPVASP